MGRRVALALGVGVIAAQAGHLVAFQLRFGAAAQQIQSSGAHTYFPTLAKTTLGILAAALLFALLIIGLARVLAARSTKRSVSVPKYIDLVACLFTVQLICFMAQEVGEAVVAGAGVDSAPHLLLWGTLGQLPIAAIAAVALQWLGTSVESAVDELRAVLAVEPAAQSPITVALAVWQGAAGVLLLSFVAGGSLLKRGPPPSLRFSS